MKVTINGKPVDPSRLAIIGSVRKVIEFLDTMPNGKCMTTDAVAKETGVRSLYKKTKDSALEPYCLLVQPPQGHAQKVFGNRKTIKAMKDEIKRAAGR